MSTIRFQARYQTAALTPAGYVPVEDVDHDERHVRTAAGARGLATRWHRRAVTDRTVVETGDADGWTYTVVRVERGPDRGTFRMARTRITDSHGDAVDYVHPIPAPEPAPEDDLSRMVSDQDYDAFRSGYRAAMLWANVNDSDAPDDDVDSDDPRLEDAEVDTTDADAFLRANLADLQSAGDGDMSQHGHDFALTRNHHGAGFWDRGYGDVGDRLTEAAHAYGEDWIDLADDAS